RPASVASSSARASDSSARASCVTSIAVITTPSCGGPGPNGARTYWSTSSPPARSRGPTVRRGTWTTRPVRITSSQTSWRPGAGTRGVANGVERLPRKVYEAEVGRLQAELVKLQEWVRSEGVRLAVVFEGRDAAGKGSAIKRVTEFLNPRVARIAALPVPTDRE